MNPSSKSYLSTIAFFATALSSFAQTIPTTATNAQSGMGQTTSQVPQDDPIARLKLTTLFKPYIRLDGSDWNVTLQLAVTESTGQVAQTVQLVGSSSVRRAFTRAGHSVISTFSQGAGVVTRDGTTEMVPVWVVQSSKVPEFPFPALLARLLTASTVVSFVTTSGDDGGLLHIKLTQPCLDSQGRRIAVAEKVYDTDLFFDLTTGLLMKERHWIFSPSSMTNNAQVEISYSNYQSIGGVEVPFHIIKHLGGIVLSDTMVQSVDLNATNTLGNLESTK